LHKPPTITLLELLLELLFLSAEDEDTATAAELVLGTAGLLPPSAEDEATTAAELDEKPSALEELIAFESTSS